MKRKQARWQLNHSDMFRCGVALVLLISAISIFRAYGGGWHPHPQFLPEDGKPPVAEWVIEPIKAADGSIGEIRKTGQPVYVIRVLNDQPVVQKLNLP